MGSPLGKTGQQPWMPGSLAGSEANGQLMQQQQAPAFNPPAMQQQQPRSLGGQGGLGGAQLRPHGAPPPGWVFNGMNYEPPPSTNKLSWNGTEWAAQGQPQAPAFNPPAMQRPQQSYGFGNLGNGGYGFGNAVFRYPNNLGNGGQAGQTTWQQMGGQGPPAQQQFAQQQPTWQQYFGLGKMPGQSDFGPLGPLHNPGF